MALRATKNRNDVRFERGAYDLRGFDVRTGGDDQKVGEVDDLLVDEGGRTIFLSVDLEGEDRHILIPTGHATSDREQHVVWLAGMRRGHLDNLPTYRGDPSEIDADYERRLVAAYGDAYSEDPYAQAEYRGRGWGRGTSREHRRIERIDRLDDIRVAKGDPDPRGWVVFGGDGSELGRIDHLLGDTQSMRVVYLVMKVERSVAEDEHHVLIPAGYAALEEHQNRVRVDPLDAGRILEAPTYDGTLDREGARALEAFYGAGYHEERRYEHPRYADRSLYGEETIERAEEELRIGKQRQPAGEVDIDKHVETERVQQPVSVHHEEVEVERRPVSSQAEAAEIREDEIHVPITREEVVVQKRPVVKEEIVIRKKDVEEEELVEEDLRRERVEVHRHGHDYPTGG